MILCGMLNAEVLLAFQRTVIMQVMFCCIEYIFNLDRAVEEEVVSRSKNQEETKREEKRRTNFFFAPFLRGYEHLRVMDRPNILNSTSY